MKNRSLRNLRLGEYVSSCTDTLINYTKTLQWFHVSVTSPQTYLVLRKPSALTVMDIIKILAIIIQITLFQYTIIAHSNTTSGLLWNALYRFQILKRWTISMYTETSSPSLRDMINHMHSQWREVSSIYTETPSISIEINCFCVHRHALTPPLQIDSYCVHRDVLTLNARRYMSVHDSTEKYMRLVIAWENIRTIVRTNCICIRASALTVRNLAYAENKKKNGEVHRPFYIRQ